MPNVFSPNGDGRNDVLFVYGNYITKLEFRIFNQWGEQMIDISNRSQGWDGTYKDVPMPSGVYPWRASGVFRDGSIWQAENIGNSDHLPKYRVGTSTMMK